MEHVLKEETCILSIEEKEQMEEQMGIVLVGILGTLGIVLILIGRYFQKRERRKQTQCTKKTTGIVIGYSSMGNKGVYYPKVHFYVNGEEYTGVLNYSSVWIRSGPRIKESEVVSDKFATTLRVRRNSFISTNPLAKIFPKGTELDVYYDPENPKQNYVHRFASNYVDRIFYIVGLVFLLLGTVFFFIF